MKKERMIKSEVESINNNMRCIEMPTPEPKEEPIDDKQ